MSLTIVRFLFSKGTVAVSFSNPFLTVYQAYSNMYNIGLVSSVNPGSNVMCMDLHDRLSHPTPSQSLVRRCKGPKTLLSYLKILHFSLAVASQASI